MNDDQTRDLVDRLSRIEKELLAAHSSVKGLAHKMDMRLTPLERFQLKVGMVSSAVGVGFGFLFYAVLGWFFS